MNQPLRYAGETFYQASFANDDRTSILQVVRNPGWLLPYIACAMVGRRTCLAVCLASRSINPPERCAHGCGDTES